MIKINYQPNSGKNLKIQVSEEWYNRYPVSTHQISIAENINPILEEIKKDFKEGDWIAISEKFITISEGRLIHKSFLKPGVLAKIIAGLIKKNMGKKAFENDPAYAIPEKIQAAIFITGWWKIFFAAILGIPLTFIYKLMDRKKGWFYIIAGNRISEIDGTFSNEMPPFNTFAKIYPENPHQTAQDIENNFGMPTVIIDGNNINTEILGASISLPISYHKARNILIDNPMGQGGELTPIILVRKD